MDQQSENEFISKENARTLMKLLAKSGRVDSCGSRKAICLLINIDHKKLNFMQDISADDFSVNLVLGEIYDKQRGDSFRLLCEHLIEHSGKGVHKQLYTLGSKRFNNEPPFCQKVSCHQTGPDCTHNYGVLEEEKYDAIEEELKNKFVHYWRHFSMDSKELANIGSLRKDYFLRLVAQMQEVRQRFEDLQFADERVLQSSIYLISDDASIIISTCEDVRELLDVNSAMPKNRSFIFSVEELIRRVKEIKALAVKAINETITSSHISVPTQRALKTLLERVDCSFDDALSVYASLGGISDS